MAETPDVGRPDEQVQNILTDVELLDLDLVENQSFEDEAVYLDGREFRNCSWTRCKLYIKLGAFRLRGSVNMQDSTFILASPAESVKNFVDLVYSKQGRLAGVSGPAVSIGSLSLSPGQQGLVDLVALDIDSPGLGAWTIDVVYDPSVVSVESCSAQQGGVCNTAFKSDVIRVTGASASGLAGDTTLATIMFRHAAKGVSELRLIAQVVADATIGNPQDIGAAILTGRIWCE